MEQKYRRRKIILHNLQIKLIFALLGIIIGVSIILVTSLYLFLKGNISAFSIPEEYAQQVLTNSLWPVVIIAIVLFIASIWAIIIITHRIYGPLYRLSAYIKKLSEGEVTEELRFRRGDAIHGLKEIYNDLRKSLEKTLHYNYQEMVKIFSGLQQILDQLYQKKIKQDELYDVLQNSCNRLAKALDVTSEAIESEKE